MLTQASLASEVQIGEFTLDRVQQHLRYQGTIITLEPKVYEVLCYLIIHHERLVSLAELHEHVWMGRVVSDTAVRRTISKLRHVLGDKDSQQPRYIKSVMKRGYQLICPIDAVDSNNDTMTASSDLPVPQDADTPIVRPHLLKPASSRIKLSRVWGSVMMLMLVTALAWMWLSKKFPSNHEAAPLPALEMKRLISSPGHKVDLAISSDERYLVYSGTDGASEQWRLFLFDQHSGQVQLLPTPESRTISAVSFVRDDQAIVYVDSQFGKSRIYKLPLNLNQPAQILLDNYFAIGGLSYHSQSDSLIFGATKQQGDNGHFYRLDLHSLQLEQLTFSSSSHVMDYVGSLSADQSQLAILRYQQDTATIRLQIYQLSNKELIHEHELDQFIGQIKWLDADRMIMLNQEGILQTLDVQNATVADLPLPAQQQYRRFALGHSNQLYTIVRPKEERHFIEADWPDRLHMKLFQLGASALDVQYKRNNTDGLWLTRKEHDYQLASYDPTTFEEQFIMSHPEFFQLIDEHPDQAKLLLKSAGRLWLFELSERTWQPISIQGQLVERGYFSDSGDEVLFTVSSGGRWLTYRYVLESGLLVQFNHGYRVLFPWNEQFLSITADGKMFRLDSDLQPEHQYPVTFVFDVPYRIQAYSQGLMVSNMQMHQTYLWQLFDNRNDMIAKSYPRARMHPKVSIAADGGQLIYFSTNQQSDQIYKLSAID